MYTAIRGGDYEKAKLQKGVDNASTAVDQHRIMHWGAFYLAAKLPK